MTTELQKSCSGCQHLKVCAAYKMALMSIAEVQRANEYVKIDGKDAINSVGLLLAKGCEEFTPLNASMYRERESNLV